MVAYNRRAEGRRPPHRGRSDRESNPLLGEIADEESISNREVRDWQRRRGRGRPHLQPPDTHSYRIYAQRESLKPRESFFSFSFGARIRFASSKHAGNPDNGWIGRKDRFSVSTTAEAIIKGIQSSGFDMKKRLLWGRILPKCVTSH